MGRYDFELDMDSDNTLSVMCEWIRGGTDVMEFGCANGRMTRYLAAQECRVTIVEIDEKAGREAARYAESAFLGEKYGDINHLHWKGTGKAYDYIIFADVLEHLPDPEKILTESKDILKKDGEILISVPNIAHNSVLIDLYLDRFDYLETGLLDQTHIHFFTYTTFVEMVCRVGLFIEKQHPIYSSVGWNEIRNSYTDVPEKYAGYLRKRKTGSAYQYVFSLTKESRPEANEREEIFPLAQDLVRQQEASCYRLEETAVHGEEKICSIVYEPKYRRKQTLSFALEAPSDTEYLRLDIAEDSILLQIHTVIIQFSNGTQEKANIYEDNAVRSMGEWYLFQTKDPHFHFSWKSSAREVCHIEAEITIWDTGFEEEQADIYAEQLRSVQEQYELRLHAAEWTRHLEKDIRKTQEEFEKYRQEASAYIEHLEKDIQKLQEQLQERH